MLTKEERAAIAERFHECDYLYDNALYQILFGHNVPSDTTFEDDSKAIFDRLANLIDPTCMVIFDKGKTICSNCGNDELFDDYLYCPRCGARLMRYE